MNGLSKSDLHPDPFRQFDQWLKGAGEAGVEDPNGMALATVGANGVPSARMILLKEYDKRGFIFYTNYDSRKGRDLAENPQAAVLFYWRGLRRQVQIVGRVERLSAAESEGYFNSRPRESQLSAAASPQSKVVASREELEKRVSDLSERYAGKRVPRPDNWGGFRLIPESFEFWQDRLNRLHDRFGYYRQSGGRWRIERLAP